MLWILVTLVIGYLFTQFSGYMIHRALHWKALGRIQRSHETHHERLYPPDDYLSDKYRDVPLKDRAYWYYIPPGLLAAGTFLLLLPLHLAVIIMAEMLVLAWLNDWFHGKLHIRGHWLERFSLFRKWRDLHYQHHVDENVNNGIMSWFSDRILRTYVPVRERPWESRDTHQAM